MGNETWMKVTEGRAQAQGSDVDAALERVTGIIQDEGMSVEDYRLERLEERTGIRLTNHGNQQKNSYD